MTLPVLATAHDVDIAATVQPVAAKTARVLLVEDNPNVAEGMATLLKLRGHRVRVTHDGMAALEAACASTPDIVFVDIGLPGMDGYEVARRVRREPRLKHVVLVALTGYGRDEDKQQAMAAGFDHHLVKPVDPDALHRLLSRLGGPGSSEESAVVH